MVSAVRGWCIGGGTGLAWVADIRIAAESARFRAGDVYLGIIPTWSVGMVRLVHYIGRNRTLDLLLLGEDIGARQALELGLVSKVVPDADFDAEVGRDAARLASGAPLPMQAIKEAVRAQYRDTPDRAAVLEENWAQRILASQDAKEGMTAFKEKRKPCSGRVGSNMDFALTKAQHELQDAPARRSNAWSDRSSRLPAAASLPSTRCGASTAGWRRWAISAAPSPRTPVAPD